MGKRGVSMFKSTKRLRLIPVASSIAAVLGITPACAQAPAAAPAPHAWSSDAAGLRLHMIGNAHIDAVWLWTWPEGDAVANSTFRSALDRLNEDPEITMTTSSSQFYEWVEKNDPVLLAGIK